MFNKDDAFQKISELTTRFDDQLATYKRPDYNETLIRRDYIDPFFKALGWDVDNSQGYFEAYREVIHEDRVKVSGKSKAPDYSFRLPGGKKLFFVEAKKPSVVVKDDVQPAYQVRRYGWSAKLPVSIVTDFEEFALYDCTKKPSPADKASTARIKYFTYKDYLNEFDFFWDTLSKEKVLRGGLDKFIVSDKIKKGTATVDKDFLLSLDEWRKELALNIALRNEITNDELNFVVQAFLNRLIFLRIAEDRNAEGYGSLKNCIAFIGGEKNVVYTRLLKLFEEADTKYNSGIFDFKADKISKRLEIDNATLRKIIQNLYYPDSPYEFSEISVEILGNAYEQFLGKQIILKSAHRATIEEKLEVRKAGGVYYTPQYIVDYIVENTVGKLIGPSLGNERKTPQEVVKLKIVDPACGSGSFLLGAYDRLLKWHRDYYIPEFERLTAIAASNEYNMKHRKDAIKERHKLPLTPDGNLTTVIKKQILLNNVYGVDIDLNAVEVTKLSLLLKCMEGETQSSINAQLHFGERILPSLENNIRCGNSLVDVDFYETFPDEDTHAIKPFSWRDAFPGVFKNGGFDAVIGNPPYVRIQTLKESSRESLDYYKNKYHAAEYGNYDLYVLFVERGFTLLKKDGELGLILPNKFFNTDYGTRLRKYLFERKALNKIVNFGHEQVFENATTYCALLFLKNQLNDKFYYIKLKPTILKDLQQLTFEELELKQYSDKVWEFRNTDEEKIFDKLYKQSIHLIDLPCEISRGSSSGNDKIFIVRKIDLEKYETFGGEVINLEKGILKKPIFATDFSRYSFKKRSNDYIIFPYLITGDAKLIEEDVLKKDFPLAYSYLNRNKALLEERAQYQKWYSFSAPRSLSLHSRADILIPLLANRGLFSVLPKNKEEYTLMASGGFSITISENLVNEKFLLGLLNSNLLFWILEKLSNVFRGGWITCTKQYFAKLPIKKFAFDNKTEKSLHDEIAKCVETMLQLNKQLQEATLPHQREQLKQRIAFTDKKIDALVYELYGLSEEEIKIVEGAGA